jgi:hypothetical protein
MPDDVHEAADIAATAPPQSAPDGWAAFGEMAHSLSPSAALLELVVLVRAINQLDRLGRLYLFMIQRIWERTPRFRVASALTPEAA